MENANVKVVPRSDWCMIRKRVLDAKQLSFWLCNESLLLPNEKDGLCG